MQLDNSIVQIANRFIFNLMQGVNLLAGVEGEERALGVSGGLGEEDKEVGEGREGDFWEERIDVPEKQFSFYLISLLVEF